VTNAELITKQYSSSTAFWFAAVILVAMRLALGSDLAVEIIYSPHDDSLYVERAWHLLSGEAFGAYGNRILIKYPGISIWLAGVRVLGIPFLISVNALYIGTGIYLLAALLRGGINRWIALSAFVLYLFNPITYGIEWMRVIREPLDTGLLVLMVAAIAHVIVSVDQGRRPWTHLAVFALTFAFSMFVREENRLLWGLLVLFVGALWWQAIHAKRHGALVVVAVALLVPSALAKGYEFGLRDFVERHYGLPIIHEFGEGQFPRLLAAIRSVRSSKDNRLVMVSQETLRKLRKEVPAFAPVIDKLPLPGAGTFSCRYQGVCSEWANGWMPFWIADGAFRAGLAPNLVAAQAYYRKVRLGIEAACAEGRLKCTQKGEGFLAPMELRWTRAFVAEGWRLAKMLFAPDTRPISEVPAVYDVPVELGRIYQAVTMTSNFDSLAHENLGSGTDIPRYVSPIAASARGALLAPYQFVAALLLLAMIVALAIRLWIADQAPLGPMALLGLVVMVYGLLRVAALTYVAVYLGPFTSRIVFSTYAVTVPLALPFIAETIVAWTKIRKSVKT